MLIGGGLAGMEAAITLAGRGHEVLLYEKSHKLGGQWNIAAMADGKDIYNTVTQSMLRDLERTKVKIILNAEVNADLVRGLKPDVAIVATGAVPRVLQVAGADGPNVVQAVDVVNGKAKVGDTAVVIGGRYLGMEVAIMLAKQDKKVSLATERELGRNGRWMERNIKITLKDRLIECGVYLYLFSPVKEVRDNGVMIVQDRELTFLKADTVVLAVGFQAQNKLLEELKGVVPEIYAVGDCVEPRDAMEAIGEAFEVALQV
jgi:pyruvate/2-oxoglutarate dehydrogenase complex dihydrolipoamide dehydrogenase (E3) component